MIVAEAPPSPPPSAPAEVVVSRSEASEVVAVQDLPLTLVKGPRREEALARRALFITATVTVVRPETGPDRYRWAYQGFLQSQVCFSSMTGLFSCTEPQSRKLPEAREGDAPLPADANSYPLAEEARAKLVADLKARSGALFAADRRANLDPLFKASGVVVAQAPPAPARKP